MLFNQDGSITKFDRACSPVGLFDKIDAEMHTIHYEGTGHIALYTDGLLEAVEGEYEEQLEYLTECLRKYEQWNEEAMLDAFFVKRRHKIVMMINA